MTTELRFSADTADIDHDRVHLWLSEESYWARGRPREIHDAAVANSRNYGVFDESGEQLGYARVITDGVTFAWLCDVFVAEAARGRGAGVRLISGIVDDLEPLGIKRMALFTEDAHGLYEKFGFAQLTDAESWMLRWGAGYGPQPDVDAVHMPG